MSKTFAQAPKPKPLTADVIQAFERGGAGQDTQTHISPKVEKREPVEAEKGEPAKAAKQEPMRRLSVDLPKSLHTRFKTACAKADTKMVVEVMNFIKRRTATLEQEK
jgi:hypothetical protein